MATKIGNLQIQVGANVAQITKDVGKIQKNIKTSMSAVQKAVAQVKTAMGAMFTGYALSAAINYGKGLIDDADAMSKLAQKTGVTVEALSSMGHAAELSGANVGILSKAFKTLAKNSNDTKDGVGEAKDAFEELGISVTQEDGSLKTLDAIMLDVADSISKMTDSTQQAAFASDIFGRSGFELLPMLKQGKEGIKKMTDEADQLGITIGTDFAKESEKANDAVTKLKGAFDGLVRVGLVDVATSLTDVANGMTMIVTSVKDFNETDTGKAIAFISSLNNPLKLYTKALEAAARARDILVFGPDVGADTDFVDSLNNTDWDGLKDGSEEAGKRLRRALVDSANEAFEGALDDTNSDAYWSMLGQDISAGVKSVVPEIVTSWSAIGEGAKQAFEVTEDASMGMTATFRGVSSAIDDFAEGTKVSFTSMVNSILKDFFKLKAQNLAMSILGGLFSGGGSSSAAKPSGIMADLEMVPLPHANGGIIASPTVALMGEAGAEAVLPLTTINGKMGVAATGGGGKMIVNIINKSDASITATESTSANGDVLDIMITNKINQAGYNGDLNSMMKTVFNVSAQGVNR